jgi:cation diffusion facilitator CzcD-associated flavoprotein CzcO
MGSHQKRVAVIGAGVSGVTTAKHLKESGIEVVVFERSRQAGGNWSVCFACGGEVWC